MQVNWQMKFANIIYILWICENRTENVWTQLKKVTSILSCGRRQKITALIESLQRRFRVCRIIQTTVNENVEILCENYNDDKKVETSYYRFRFRLANILIIWVILPLIHTSFFKLQFQLYYILISDFFKYQIMNLNKIKICLAMANILMKVLYIFFYNNLNLK